MSTPVSQLIAPFKTGLDTDIQPWLAPPDSFSVLNNLHIEHGFLERRNGYQFFAPSGQSTLTNGTAVTGFGIFIETDTGAQTMLAFDTMSAYSYSGATESFTQLTSSYGAMSATIFSGANNDYVWSGNWQSTAIANVNRLYFTNGLSWNNATETDGIWYFSGGPTVTPLLPTTGGANFLVGGRLIFSLGQRLVVLYTFEAAAIGAASTRYPQRARWCAKQNPANWDDTVAGGGDFADAATSDQIISAQLLQNQIIVFFTNSVWSLVPTSDPNKAFRWQKINNFRSCDGKMASVAYDRFTGALGIRGITATDGINTTRMDDRISDFTIEEISQADFENTFCARDYNNRRWWSLFSDGSSTANNKALIFDDDSGGFSTYDIEMNALGYGIEGSDYEFQDFSVANNKDFSFDDFGEDETFLSYYFQGNVQLFVGGDTSGNIYQLDVTSADLTIPIDSSFTTAAWNPFKEEGKECLMPYMDFFIETSPSTTAVISFYKDTSETPYTSQLIDFLPDLNFIAGIADIDQANPCNVNAPGHGLSTGDEIYIYLVEGMVEINSGEEGLPYTVTVIDEDNITLDGIDSSAFTAYTTGGSLFFRQFYRTKTWKRAYAGGIGFQHRIMFTASGAQDPFRVHALKPSFKARGKRMIN
jgi:hypothetical protein